MGRWTQYDEDEYRLPDGMKRVGYDADTGCYYFRDKEGALWEGLEGAVFGEMRRVDTASVTISTEDDDVESGHQHETRTDGYQLLATDTGGSVHHTQRQTSPYRTLFPFFLLIAVTLLLVFRLVDPSHSSSHPPCPENSTEYYVKSGDTCWQISKTYGCNLENMVKINDGLKCEALKIGQKICIPYADS